MTFGKGDRTVKKREVIESWHTMILKSSMNTRDKPALRESWNIYIDALIRNGDLTEKQVASWKEPQPAICQ
jgi:hypothetical protein